VLPPRELCVTSFSFLSPFAIVMKQKRPAQNPTRAIPPNLNREFYCANRLKKLSDFHAGLCASSATRNASFSKIALNRAAAAKSTG
jgi:hypothetical protein